MIVPEMETRIVSLIGDGSDGKNCRLHILLNKPIPPSVFCGLWGYENSKCVPSSIRLDRSDVATLYLTDFPVDQIKSSLVPEIYAIIKRVEGRDHLRNLKKMCSEVNLDPPRD